MTKGISVIALAVVLGLTGSCGSSNPGQSTDPTCVDPAEARCRIAVTGNSFVQWTGPVTDGVAGGVSTAVVEHTPGRFCMSGTVDSGPDGSGWGAILLVGLATADDSTGALVTPLDASALGIAQVRFTVEDPPLTGILPQMAELESASCKTVPDCLATFDSTAVINPGPVTVALGDFAKPDANHPNAILDPKLIDSLQFYVGPLPGVALPYDFCIRDLAFLDDSGQEITP
jgi:hypothetical protein